MDASLMTFEPDEAAGRLLRVERGDRAAFTTLVEAYDADMAHLCFVICGDVELARDATQSAWWQAMCACSDPPRPPEATYLGLTATAYHLAGLFGGLVMAVVAAVTAERGKPARSAAQLST